MTSNTVKISRGYRLKPATHKLIKSLEALTESDTDTIISKSCMLYYKKLLEQNERSAIKDKLNYNRNEN